MPPTIILPTGEVGMVVDVAVDVGVLVTVGVAVSVGMITNVSVGVGMSVSVGVSVPVGVSVDTEVAVSVDVAVNVGAGVGEVIATPKAAPLVPKYVATGATMIYVGVKVRVGDGGDEGVYVNDGVQVMEGVLVIDLVQLADGVREILGVQVRVLDGVRLFVCDAVKVPVRVAVPLAVGLAVAVAVGEAVAVGVRVAVGGISMIGIGVGGVREPARMVPTGRVLICEGVAIPGSVGNPRAAAIVNSRYPAISASINPAKPNNARMTTWLSQPREFTDCFPSSIKFPYEIGQLPRSP